MARRFAVATFVLVATAVFAATANATKPVRGPAAGPPSFTFPAGMVCPFPVLAEAVENRQTETIFSNGEIQYTGFFLTRVTNTANGKSADFVSGGPARLTPTGNLLTLETRGPIVFFFFPGDAGPGDDSTGRTYYFRGHTEVLVDPATFEFLEFGFTGNATDVCAMLA